MKLILAVVQNKDSARLSQALLEGNYRVTKLASTGGFLRKGNTTFLIGTDDDKVQDVLDTIKTHCKARQQLVTPVSLMGSGVDAYTYPIEVEVGGATVFVMPVESFHHF